MTDPHERGSTRGPLIVRDGERPSAPGAVVAIGNFDGVHLGHRRLVASARREADERGRPAAALTFEPHPRDFFRPDEPAFRLTPEPVKAKILGRLGIDLLAIRRFDAALAATTAERFVTEVLKGQIDASLAIIGHDFHFGRGRTGTPATLQAVGRAHAIDVLVEPAVEAAGGPVSSSRIRAALEAGDVAGANALLGYRWFVAGEVEHGAKRGRTLGYPTANMALGRGCRLAHGIYAVRAAIGGAEIRDGVASFGRRPTFDDGPPLLETFLFDFSGDLYGRTIEVELVSRIRGEVRFSSAEELVARMDLDSQEARAALRRGDGLDSFIGP